MGVTGRRRLVAQPGGLTFGFGQTLSILGLIFFKFRFRFSREISILRGCG